MTRGRSKSGTRPDEPWSQTWRATEDLSSRSQRTASTHPSSKKALMIAWNCSERRCGGGRGFEHMSFPSLQIGGVSCTGSLASWSSGTVCLGRERKSKRTSKQGRDRCSLTLPKHSSADPHLEGHVAQVHHSGERPCWSGAPQEDRRRGLQSPAGAVESSNDRRGRRGLYGVESRDCRSTVSEAEVQMEGE